MKKKKDNDEGFCKEMSTAQFNVYNNENLEITSMSKIETRHQEL